jgi:hypothetical protein
VIEFEVAAGPLGVCHAIHRQMFMRFRSVHNHGRAHDSFGLSLFHVPPRERCAEPGLGIPAHRCVNYRAAEILPFFRDC